MGAAEMISCAVAQHAGRRRQQHARAHRGTPLVRLRHLVDPTMADIFCKCEQFNPGGSLKDRIALSMIEAAEREGRHPAGRVGDRRADLGQHRHRAGAGVRGQGLPADPDHAGHMSLERRALLKAYGAELHPDARRRRSMEGAVERARSSAARTRTHFMPQQFNNPANPEVHRRTTARRSSRSSASAAARRVRAGVGTGGTITGVGEVLRAQVPDVRIVAVEPATSAVLSGGAAGRAPHRGHRRRLRAAILDRSRDHARCARSPSATRSETKVELARREGLLVGISAGASVKIALDVARELGPGKTRRHRPVRHRRALLLARTQYFAVSGDRRPRACSIIGAGGLGCPAALALARGRACAARRRRRRRVDAVNLHRQILHRDADVGRAQGRVARARAARAASRRWRRDARVALRRRQRRRAGRRATTSSSTAPTTSRPSSWSTTPACWRGEPLVHGARGGAGRPAADRRRRGGRPCYRCLFEEPPPPGVGAVVRRGRRPRPGRRRHRRAAGRRGARRCWPAKLPLSPGASSSMIRRAMTVRAVRFNPNPRLRRLRPRDARIRALAAADYPGAECAVL